MFHAVRPLCPRHARYSRSLGSQAAPSWVGKAGIAFDIDGVLIRGKQLIPEAHTALHRISGPEYGGSASTSIPYVLLTNGGGVTEAVKARQVSEWVDLRLPGDAVCLSHSPMKSLVAQYRHQRVLVLGMTDVKSVALSYGFTDVITVKELADRYPALVPNMHRELPGGAKVDQQHKHNMDHLHEDDVDRDYLRSIEAILVMHDPNQWYSEIQIVLDVLTSRPDRQTPIYLSNGDFLFTGRHWAPRLAQGSFRLALRAIYHKYTGRQLQYTMTGKPEVSQFEYAQSLLNERARALGFREPLQRLYMIGDNCAADIRGANRAREAGHPWHSVWVKTGTIEPSNLAIDKPEFVSENVDEAVQFILHREQQLGERDA